MLDLFQNNQAIAAKIQPNEGTDLPAGFGDSFDTAWHEGQLFGSSISHGMARLAAFDQFETEFRQKTGKQFDINSEGGADPWDQANDQIRDLKAKNPSLDIAPVEPDEIDRRAAAVSGDAHHAYTAEREQTFGGKVGSVLGSLASGTVDPINLVGLAVAPEAELGVLGTAAAFGAIGAVSQGVNEAAQAGFREQVQPGYMESGQPGMNIVGGAVGGAVLGGGFKAAGALWSRLKTGDWPRSVRDAGNIVESEANVQQSNILPGADGEAAHREALAKSIDDIVAGRAVDAPESVSAVPEPQPGGIVAYHGSPHEFDRFDVSKIGTGEGAQAYGHGLYFAENEGVAKSYRDALTDATIEGKRYDPYNALHVATAQVEESGSRAAAIKEIEKSIEHDPGDPSGHFPRVLAILKSDRDLPKIDIGSGALYQVRINADQDKMLDWDKPLSEQSQHVQDAISQLRRNKEIDSRIDSLGDDPKMQGIYGAIGRGKTSSFWSGVGKTGSEADVAASKVLADAGVPGIKYLDRGSRDEGDGTRNFVIFNDRDVQITHKNGKPLNLFESSEAKIDQMMGDRGAASELTAAAKEERAASGELPFDATAKEAQAEQHVSTLSDQLESLGLPKEDAADLADRVIAAKSDDEARAILNEAMARPMTIAETVPSVAEMARAERLSKWADDFEERATVDQLRPESRAATLADPKADTAMMTDLERMRDTGQGGMIPFGVDEKGEPQFKLLDAAIQDAKNDAEAADQIEACINPPAEEAAE